MAARGKPGKLLPLATAVLFLMVAAAFAGCAAANSGVRASSPSPLLSSSPSSGSSPSSSPTASPSTVPSASSTSPPSPSGQGAACVTSDDNGSCGPYDYPGITGSSGGNTYVIQDVWNSINGASQILTAYSPDNWSVSADMPASNTAVVSYPDTQETYTTANDTPDPLSGFNSITSSYTESGPGSGGGNDYEAAYDIWAGTGSENYAQEIMIWTDDHGQTPAGSDVASATIDGVRYQIWSVSRAGVVGNPVSMVMDSNRSSGSVKILDDLKWLESNGYMPAGSGLNQIDFGWEICSTGGIRERFSLSGYGIESSCASGSSCTG
jgi:Glycosyl hydrolase family 12